MDINQISKLNCRQLRSELHEAGLSQSGKKAELQQRLIFHIQGQTQTQQKRHIEVQNSDQKAKLAALELEIEILKKQQELDKLKRGTSKTTDSDFSGLKEAMVDAVYASHVQVVEPTIFDGDPLKYTVWKIQLESLIESPQIKKRDRLNILTKYLKGKALSVVQHLLYVRDDGGFDNAMSLLDGRFGDSFRISEAFRSKLEQWNDIKPYDNDALYELSDFVQQCLQVKRHVPGLAILDDGRENQKLLRHLPAWFITKWREKIVEYRAQNNQNYPTFEVFAKFLRNRAEVNAEPITGALFNSCQKSQSQNKPEKPCTSLSTQSHNDDNKRQANSNGSPKQKPCAFCSGLDHRLSACSKFREKPWSERHEFVKQKGLCFACLSYGHPANKCTSRHSCGKCKKSHPTCLHNDITPDSDSKKNSVMRNESKPNQNSEETIAHAVNSDNAKSIDVEMSHCIDNADKTRMLNIDNRENFFTTIVPVWISSKGNPSDEILVYALLDSMSNKCFVLSDVYDQLDSDYFDTTLKLGTMASKCTEVATRGSLDLQIRSFYDRGKVIPLPPTYTRDFIPADESSIPNPKSVAAWPHLSRLASEIPEKQECPIGLLLSYKCLQAFLPRECIVGGDSEPFALKTDLGWLIMGPETDFNKDCDNIGMTHCVMSLPAVDSWEKEKSESNSHVKFKCTHPIQESFSQQILKVLESDFNDIPSEKTLSQNDIKFLTVMNKGIRQDAVTKHYSMPLPIKDKHDILPDNRRVVLNRLNLLRQKLTKDPDYKNQYFEFMNAMINGGEAEPVVSQKPCEGRIWYIPHFGVKHAKKNKLRIVFDCSSKHQGVSLNDCLVSGPDHINSLVGILMRFRLNNVALTCDIEKMFYQFIVDKDQRDFLRFLWFADETMSDVVDYRMTVHLFGATSSPACATYGLRAIAGNHHDPNDPSSVMAKRLITRDFYVDDGICSVSDVKTACELVKNARHICSQGGVRLHKFLSSSVEVMKSIPASECAASVQSLILGDDSLPVERTLGIAWSVERDEFQFSVNLVRHQIETRRTLLSTIASVYDPLGWLAPFILRGKQLLQSLCQAKLSWDDELPSEYKIPWKSWLSELSEIENIRIPRQYWPDINPYIDLKSLELHHFSDASTSGYGQCSYLRMISQANKVKCALIMGKARVTPKKVVTIPRLELQAAVVSVKIAQHIKGEISSENLRQYYWTDSTAVLGYITNEDRQYHTYVANRVQTIRNYTDPSQWFYVKSKSNPADIASRTCNVSDLSYSWLNGPEFLYDAKLDIESCRTPKIQVPADDPEVKCIVNSVVSVDDAQVPFGLYDRLLDISDWNRMINLVGVFKNKAWSLHSDTIPDSIELKQRCIQYIIRELQRHSFRDELNILEKGSKRQLPKSSPLFGLNPFLDSDGIIRVGGRCSRARWEISEKHPRILPRRAHITDVIARFYRNQYAHQGRATTVNAIRSHGFWVIGISRVVSSIIHYCVTCRKERGAVGSQKMADLPSARVEEGPPFTSVGCDCFGPFQVHENRKQLKKYGVLYTCMYSRAVHIEILDDLSTDSFINSFRCVTSIRGNIRKIFCDRGTNFIGALSSFKTAFDSMTDTDLVSRLKKQDCTFVFNPPNASHMGGVWERQIRTIRSILTNLINKHPCRLNSSELRTLFCETMAIINSRPLSVENLYDATSPRPLTPNHLLTMKSEVVLPAPGRFCDSDLYTRKRWKKIQFMANAFWKDWKKQYISTLQTRSKWIQSKPNVKVGAVVIISDENSPRNMWNLGRVAEVFKGDDGLVRKVRLFTGAVGGRSRYVERPIHRLVVLVD